MPRYTFAVCPVGSAAGHDADECRANRNLDDGSILCITCDTVYPNPDELSPRSLRVLRLVAQQGFGTPKFLLGSQSLPGTPEYNAACLSGHDPSQSTQVRAHYGRGRLSISLNWDKADNASIENFDTDVGRTTLSQIGADELASIPEPLKKLALALEAEGFCFRALSPATDSYRSITLTCGKSIGKMGHVAGISATLSWY